MDFISETSTEYLLSLRIVRIEIAPGIYENLITNLPDIEFDMDDLKEFYHLRWSQENAYRDLKYPLCLKAFHSKKYTYIVQEVFARTIMHNYCSAISQHIELPDHSRKLQYQINFSEAIKICRDDLRSRTKNNAIDKENICRPILAHLLPIIIIYVQDFKKIVCLTASGNTYFVILIFLPGSTGNNKYF